MKQQEQESTFLSRLYQYIFGQEEQKTEQIRLVQEIRGRMQQAHPFAASSMDASIFAITQDKASLIVFAIASAYRGTLTRLQKDVLASKVEE